MKRYMRSQLSDGALHRSAITNAARERGTTADLLADLAEIDTRRSYLAMAYPSLFAYCVAELKLSEDAAYNRIKVAREARRYPIILDALADGRLNLSAVLLLKPHLTETTAPELIPAAMDKSKIQIEKLLAERFPRLDVPAFIAAISQASPEGHSMLTSDAVPIEAPAGPLASVQTPLVPVAPRDRLVPEPVVSDMRSKVKPLAPKRYEIHFSMSESCHDKLRYLQDLLGFDLPPGDLGSLFEDALDARIREVEKHKFAATSAPRRSARPSENQRHIPAHVKRAVWKRDGARCTFIGDNGQRCQERGFNSTMSGKSRAEARQGWRTSDCVAGRTTSSPPSARSAPSSCGTRESRRARHEGRPGRRPRPGPDGMSKAGKPPTGVSAGGLAPRPADAVPRR